MKKYIYNLESPKKYSYISINTTGLSYNNSEIFSIGILLGRENKICLLIIEDLKEEEKLLKETLEIIKGNDFIAYNGDFVRNFLMAKISAYNLPVNFEIISLLKRLRTFSYIFKSHSFAKSSMDEYFSLPKDELSGKELAKIIDDYLKLRDEKIFEKIKTYAYKSLLGLENLHTKIENFLESYLNFSLKDYRFYIDEILLIKNILTITGRSDYKNSYFSANGLYTLSLGENFKIQINSLNNLYDEKNYCYYVKKKDFKGLKNSEVIKSPKEILIIYYKDYIIENILNLIKYILDKEI
ncbi:ribonuclease H-like domain-containing protein [uncultured Peptoniphilus sp.]|uniref:ribonuclease H-like domain-containing protein n=1 Tax=uncultured Peptoniphilus sp. TaxID=254354 RepID=UPI002803D216|nr:ribonuclease H-like domain-containing protein [uncultured Peptoniphilus sp.]